MKFSKIGIVLVIVYLIISGAFIWYGSRCTIDALTCGLTGLLPGLPWIFIAFFLGASPETNGWILLFVGIILNSGIMYLVGLGLSRLFRSLT